MGICTAICFEDTPTDIEDYKPPEVEGDKPESQQRGQFYFKAPTRKKTDYKGKPIINRVYGLLVGKWDYTDCNQSNLPDVKHNMKQGEQYMTLLGVQPDDLVVITDPTPKQMYKAIRQLVDVINQCHEQGIHPVNI